MTHQIIQHPNGKLEFISPDDFIFENGARINPLHIVYECYGELAASKDNVIVINHALSTNSHVRSHSQDSSPGWWEEIVGPEKPIDTNHYFVICINNLGSCFGSSGPSSINVLTGKPYQADFPQFTFLDIARSQQLLLEALGIKQLHALVGNSMGGMISLEYAIHFPQRLKHLVLISSAYKAYAANIANRLVQREIIQLDPEWHQGYYANNPVRGLKVARKLGHFTYRNPRAINQKFQDPEHNLANERESVTAYLEHNAQRFAENYDTNTYLYFLHAMDHFDVTQSFASPDATFSRIQAKVLVVSVDSDILFLPEQQCELYEKLQAASVCCEFIQHHSTYGHDAFLVEHDDFGRYISQFISREYP